MTRLSSIRPEFVEFVPKELEDGVLYVSFPYSTTVHKCACGCGHKVTLPINLAKWRLLWDGERISIWPSVGNHSFPCRSHYWIEQNQIEWARTMSPGEIERNRASDRAERERYLRARDEPHPVRPPRGPRRGLIDRLRGLIRR